MRRKFRIAAVQIDCSGSILERKRSARIQIEAAAKKGARLACLPEHWIPGSDVDLAELLPFFSDLATKTGMYIVPGADFVKDDQDASVRVESILLDPRGGEIGRQQKVHLFGRENELARPGSEYRVFDVEGVKIGIAICHDLVYPEVARILALKGAEIVLAPSKIDERGIAPWELYVKTRALENRIPVVSPNFLSPPEYPGSSMIVDFRVSTQVEGARGRGGGGAIVYPSITRRGGSRQTSVVAELDLDAIRPHRIERLGARRPDTYSDLLHTPV